MTSSVTIRPATPADLSVCAAIINEYIDETPWLPRVRPREEIEAVFEPALLERRTILVAENGVGVVGYLSMDEAGTLVPALYLRPQARGRGLGKALLDAAKARLPGGFRLTVFEDNVDALRFYAREGLVEAPELRNDDTEEGIAILTLIWSGHADR